MQYCVMQSEPKERTKKKVCRERCNPGDPKRVERLRDRLFVYLNDKSDRSNRKIW